MATEADQRKWRQIDISAVSFHGTSREVNGTSMPTPPDKVVYTRDSEPPGMSVAFCSDRTVSPT